MRDIIAVHKTMSDNQVSKDSLSADAKNRLIPPGAIHCKIETSDKGDWNTPDSLPPHVNHVAFETAEVLVRSDKRDWNTPEYMPPSVNHLAFEIAEVLAMSRFSLDFYESPS